MSIPSLTSSAFAALSACSMAALSRPWLFRLVSPRSQKLSRGNNKIFEEKVPDNQYITFLISFKKYMYLPSS
jgi:hypothetical protein